MSVNPENVLLDSQCPVCERTAVLELNVMAEMYEPQQLIVNVRCHFCDAEFSKLVAIDEMEVCGE